ncbi:MAG: hypothetical protein GQ561_08575 [Calditrichae bacterium]|nr:hypothetical protein [Calditrichia bacterium]
MKASIPNQKLNMRNYILTLSAIISILLFFLLISGCSSNAARFSNNKPITQYRDDHPIPVPKSTEYEKLFYAVNVLARRPAVKGLEYDNIDLAKDVNSMDEVPASSWFTPRLGYKKISPKELLAGPENVGPPQLPLTVVKAKVGGANPGFIISDARGKRYLMKFDPPHFPAIETTTALIVNRLFWGFGYNVPEDYLFLFHKDDLSIDPAGELTREDVAEVLRSVSLPVDGVYRSTVSLLIEGIVLGPIPDKGVRKDDPNDKIPHENRRVLRALRVFSAFTNHSDIRIDNSMDVYVGQTGKGYVEHFLLDFGEAFGGHGAEHDYLWDGFNHWFSYSNFFQNLVTFGLKVHNWESIRYTSWKSVGAFESKVFNPGDWKEVSPYEPIRVSQPDDDYWAAKILAALTRDHITELVKAANYPDQGASEYIIETLMERRRKVLEYFLNQVSPLDLVRFSDEELQLKDMGNVILNKSDQNTHYEILFYDDTNNRIAEKKEIFGDVDNQFVVSIPNSLMEKTNVYFRVDVWVWRGNQKAPTPAQFHLRTDNNSFPRLVGILH